MQLLLSANVCVIVSFLSVYIEYLFLFHTSIVHLENYDQSVGCDVGKLDTTGR